MGQTIEHGRRRTITESDNLRFCDITVNQQPLHLDQEFTAETQLEKRLVNGLHTMSLAVGLTIPDTTNGTIVANLSYNNVKHPEPVFNGDTIQMQSIVTDKHETSSGERGIITMHIEVFKINDPDEPLVCEFHQTILSLKRSQVLDG